MLPLVAESHSAGIPRITLEETQPMVLTLFITILNTVCTVIHYTFHLLSGTSKTEFPN